MPKEKIGSLGPYITSVDHDASEFTDHIGSVMQDVSFALKMEPTRANTGRIYDEFMDSLGLARLEKAGGNEPADTEKYDIGDVTRLFNKVRLLGNSQRYGKPIDVYKLTEEEKRVWELYSHPANFDFPTSPRALETWTYVQRLAAAIHRGMLRKGDKSEFAFDPETIMFFVQALSKPELRRALHATQFNPAVLKGTEDQKLRALVPFLAATGAMNVREGSYDDEGQPIPTEGGGPVYRGLDHFFPTTSGPRAEQNKEIRRELAEIARKSHALSEQNVAHLRSASPEKIATARYIAVQLTKRMRQGLRTPDYVMPSVVYDLLYKGFDKAATVDPILFAWSEKLRQERELNKDKAKGEVHQEISLEAAWQNAPAQYKKPKNDALVLKILRRIDERKLQFYTLADVLGEGDRATAEVRALLNHPEPARKLWEWGWNRAHTAQGWQTTEVLRKLAKRFGYTKPDSFVKRPEDVSKKPVVTAPAAPTAGTDSAVVASVAPAPTPVPTSEDIVSAAAIEASPEQAEDDTSVLKTAASYTKAERAGIVDAAQALFGKTGSSQKGLFEASFDGHRPYTKEGLPSLPHVALLWAAHPHTRALGIRAMTEAFNAFWSAEEDRNTYEGTAKQHFAWAAVAAMKERGTLFENHQAFIDAVHAEAKTGLAAPSVDRLFTVIDVVQRAAVQATKAKDKPAVKLEGNDRRAAAELLLWTKAVGGVGAKIFLGHRPGQRFLKRLNEALQA